MPSNADLIKLIAELDADAATEGLTNAELVELRNTLKAEAEAAPVKKGTVVVAEGKAVTTLAGVKGEGAVVKAEMFAGGQTVVDDLVERKVCVKA